MTKGRTMKGNYIVFSAIGSDYEKYISALIEKRIRIFNSYQSGNVLYVQISPFDYKTAARAAAKLHIRTRVIKRHGSYFYMRKYGKRYGIALGVLSFFGIITLMSDHIWEIRISGNTEISDNQILEMLRENGVYWGADSKGIDGNRIEILARLAIPDLAWISVEHDGSIINVKVSEQIKNEKAEIPLSQPCNIIAAHDGQIVNTEVYSGQLLYPIGSGVAKGQLIVSGVVEDGGGNNMLLHANAKIIAEYTEEVEFTMPFTSSEKVLSGNKSTKDYLKFFGMKIPLGFGLDEYKSSKYTEETKNVTFLGLEMPWKIITETFEEYITVEVTRTADDLRNLLKKQVENYRTNFLSDAEIISRDMSFAISDSGIAVKAVFVVHSDIAQPKEISIIS